MTDTGEVTSNGRVLQSAAQQNTILLELFGKYGVQEGVGAAVEWQDEDCQDFGFVKVDQILPKGCSEREEGYWSPTDEICEH